MSAARRRRRRAAAGSSASRARLVEVGAVELVAPPTDPPRSSGASTIVDVVLGRGRARATSMSRRSAEHAGRDLEAHRPPEAAPAQLELDRGQQVVGLVLLERQVGVPGHPERRGARRSPCRGTASSRWAAMTCSSGHEPLAVGQDHEARQQRRDLHPGDPLAPRSIGSPTRTSQVERQVRDVREGVARVDGQRREHREDLPVERPRSRWRRSASSSVRPVRHRDPGVGQGRAPPARGRSATGGRPAR